MAKVIHANGSRADKPFISVNCGAIPDSLLESELFGHKKGAFTGAANDRRGKFESAHTGTIFLDEIGELPLVGQVKLLRVLEAHEIQRVGSDEVICGGRAHRGGHQQGPAADEPGGHLPRRPVLPAQCDSCDAAGTA